MTDIVERLRERVVEIGPSTTGGGQPFQPWWSDSCGPSQLQLDAAAEIVRLRLRLADLEVSIAAFRQTVKDWEF